VYGPVRTVVWAYYYPQVWALSVPRVTCGLLKYLNIDFD